LIELWNVLFFQPILNGLIILYNFTFHNFGLAIVAFTIFIRLATLPLTLRQLETTKKMSALQPRIQELQKKYAKDRERLAQEQMRLYREAGVNPAGCLFPIAIQLPIWIALYQAIIRVLAVTPDELLNLSRSLYSVPMIYRVVPLDEKFLWLDLSQPDRTMLLPILVAASLWVQQKMTTIPSADPRQQSMNNMMLWFMPMMFGLFALQFASGLALYWVVFNIIGIIIQYLLYGWGGLKPLPAPAKPIEKPEKRVRHGGTGVHRQDRRRSHSEGPRKPRAKN